MKIVACLSWYSEQPAMLDRCVRSLAGLADELVAFDGRWQHFDDGAVSPLSDISELDAIERAADAAGLSRLVVRVDEVWSSQVAKRAAMCEAALASGADWMLVIDADEFIASADAEKARGVLAATDGDLAPRLVAQVRCAQVNQPKISGPIRRIYSTRGGLTVERAHMGYRTRDGRWLHGDHAFVSLEPALDLSSMIFLHHDVLGRDPERKNLRLDYRTERRTRHLESWAKVPA